MLRSIKLGLCSSWLIKASELNGTFCVVMFNQITKTTYVSFLKNQEDARDFIVRVVEG